MQHDLFATIMYKMGMRDLPDIYARRPRAYNIRQIPSAHVITNIFALSGAILFIVADKKCDCGYYYC